MPNEGYTYFFSYSRADSEFVLKLATELRAAGANVWLDQLDILGGRHWDTGVEEALKSCQGVLAVLSPEAVASKNVMDEVSYALEKDKLVIPVLLRACEIPFRLRRLQHVDFTGDYQRGFPQLQRALHIEQASQSTEGGAPSTPTAPTDTAIPEEPPVEAPSVEKPLERPKPPQREKKTAPQPEKSSAKTPTADARNAPEAATTEPASTEPAAVSAGLTTTVRKRVECAVTGGVVGAILGSLAFVFVKGLLTWYMSALFPGIGWAIAGALTGTHRKVIGVAAAGVAVGWLGILLSIEEAALSAIQVAAFSAVIGGAIGAVAGAVVGVVLKKWRRWT
jgi:hypothetical protein